MLSVSPSQLRGHAGAQLGPWGMCSCGQTGGKGGGLPGTWEQERSLGWGWEEAGEEEEG